MDDVQKAKSFCRPGYIHVHAADRPATAIQTKVPTFLNEADRSLLERVKLEGVLLCWLLERHILGARIRGATVGYHPSGNMR
jgi:hypothetical protein